MPFDGCRQRHAGAVAFAAALFSATPSPALSQIPPTGSLPGAPQTRAQQPLEQTPSPPADGGIWQRGRLLGDPGGIRSKLEDAGISITLQETSEVLGNVTGDLTGAIYEGATLAALQIDTAKAIGLPGGTFKASMYQIHGQGLTGSNLGNLDTVSNIEAVPGSRLFDLWYEQTMLGGALSLRLGQQAADAEFQVTTYGGVFINGAFGWPTLAATALPAGGPAYPLAALGGRIKMQPRDDLAMLLGVYSGSPAPAGQGDPQVRNASGTSFVLNQGVFVIGEVQYAINTGDQAAGLPGTYKLGAWYNSNAFPDQRFGADGRLLADPSSGGVPLSHSGNYSVYAVADQLIWREPGTKDQGIGVFARVTASSGDRNPVSAFVNAGVTWKGAFHSRPDDTIGIGVGFARISDTARQADGDVALFSGTAYPRRASETVLELTYQAAVTPWLTLQPDFQYIFSPGGGVPGINNPANKAADAAVLGLRSVVVF
nr:carbohydrate porin [uncultured Rhodopila sp.]